MINYEDFRKELAKPLSVSEQMRVFRGHIDFLDSVINRLESQLTKCLELKETK